MKLVNVAGLILVAVAGSSHLSAKSCGEVQPTLRDYQIQELGESYVTGNGLIAPPSDSETCEKIRYDLRVHHCRHKASKGIFNGRRRSQVLQTEQGVPFFVKKAMEMKASRIAGGQAAKDRLIAAARKEYGQSLAEMKAAQIEMRKFKAAYLEAHSRLVANSCDRGIFAEGRDPFVDGRK